MREQRRRETQHSWMRSTQSSTSQRVRVERSVMNMRWDRLRHNPGEQQQRTQPSNAMTSLDLYLDKTKTSELCWQRESLALEKQSLCRSWSWTGLKGKRIRTSSSYFHCLSEKSTWWRTKHSVFQIFFMSFSLKLKKWKYPVMNIKCCSSWWSGWVSSVSGFSEWCEVVWCKWISLSGRAADEPHCGESASLCSHLDHLQTSSSWSRPLQVCPSSDRGTRLQWATEGGILQEENQWSESWPIQSSHTWSHQGASTSCATSQCSAGSQPLFWRRCWVE